MDLKDPTENLRYEILKITNRKYPMEVYYQANFGVTNHIDKVLYPLAVHLVLKPKITRLVSDDPHFFD